GVHYQNKTEWADYTGEILEHNRLPLNRAYVPTQEQMLIRETALLLKRGYLERDYFQKKFNVDIYKKWDAVWKEYEQEGYLTRTDDRVELTREGLLRADSLLSAFFEEQFKGVRYT
ncbi:MAG: coproporphyrinogen III oxidase, partial [Pirellulaceae bacterium]